MKKFLLFLCVVNIYSFVFSAVFKSNIMAQNLGPADSESEYTLEETGLLSILKKGETVVKRFSYKIEGDYEVRTEENVERNTVITRKYKDGLLMEMKTETPEETETVVFTYVNGSLILTTTTREKKAKVSSSNATGGRLSEIENTSDSLGVVSPEGSGKTTHTANSDPTSNTSLAGGDGAGTASNVEKTSLTGEPNLTDGNSMNEPAPDSPPAEPVPTNSGDLLFEAQNAGSEPRNETFDSENTLPAEKFTEYYVRNAVTGALVGTRLYNSDNFAGRAYLIEGDNLYKQYNENLIYQDKDNLVFNEDGSFSIKEGETSYNYSDRGMLLSTNTKEETVQYFYDSKGSLVRQEITKEKTRSVQYYANGALTKTENYRDSVLENTVRYSEEGYGSVRTVYSQGLPLADVYYDEDNVKILKIEYL